MPDVETTAADDRAGADLAFAAGGQLELAHNLQTFW
jgi:hypothetical protein